MKKKHGKSKIDFLESACEDKYLDFLLSQEYSLFYLSPNYRVFLEKLLNEKSCYFLAFDDGNEIVGVLPAFIKRNVRYGDVLNSLPFYGSNGGVVAQNGDLSIKRELLGAFKRFAKDNNCVSTTIITSPFDSDNSLYKDELNYTFKDYRIGQFTFLPPWTDDYTTILAEKFSSVRGRNIRKAIANGVCVEERSGKDCLKFLRDTHYENMSCIGGLAKPDLFFDLIDDCFEEGDDYKLFIAFKDNKMIAALLLFYFSNTVEYFVPVIVEQYRSIQPLSLIIFDAMQDAAKVEQNEKS